MMVSFDRALLGRTGLPVGRLGISASYGVPTAAVEEAFERGVNYLYWGSIRRDAFGDLVSEFNRVSYEVNRLFGPARPAAGLPLNLWADDNGFLFTWSMEFDAALQPGCAVIIL